MALTQVWSEREAGGWTECTEASYLMAMAYGGYPFGAEAYTDAVRDALDAAANYPGVGNTFEYVDQGAMLLFGVGLRTVPRSSLATRLMQPGRALAIAGSFSRLPLGHPMRRWQPHFTGGHAVCVVPLGHGNVLWLDPLAPDGHPGDREDITAVLSFADGWSGWNPREALDGELVPTSMEDDMSTDFSNTLYQQPKYIWLRKGAAIYTDEFGRNKMGELDEDTEVFMPGYRVGQLHLVSRVDRLNGPVWVYQEAIIPEGSDPARPFRRLALPSGADAKLAQIKTIVNS